LQLGFLSSFAALCNRAGHYIVALWFLLLLLSLLGEEAEASPSIGNTLWRVLDDVHAFAITPPEVNGFGRDLVHSEYLYCLELALIDFGRDPRRSESWSVGRFFVFFVR